MFDPRHSCRLCRGERLDVALRLPHSPQNISRLPRAGDTNPGPVELTVRKCRDCGFVQLTQGLKSDFYDDYLMTVTHSPQMNRHMAAQAADFVHRFSLAGQLIVEIGCGDGNYLTHLRDAGAQVVGTEPSARFRSLACDRGFVVSGGYVTREVPVPGGPFAGFVARQVLEHVLDLHGFLSGARRSLQANAVGLVEVPRLEKTLEEGRFYDFFPDHVNYFSAATLRAALELNLFDVIEVRPAMDGEYLEAFFRCSAEPDFSNVISAHDQLCAELRSFVAACQARGERVAVWGAGGKGTAVLAAANLSGIAYVVDSDPHKHGRMTPVSGLPIVPPDRLQTDPVGAVVVTALAYRDEVLAQLHDLGFRGRVAVLGRRLVEVT